MTMARCKSTLIWIAKQSPEEDIETFEEIPKIFTYLQNLKKSNGDFG